MFFFYLGNLNVQKQEGQQDAEQRTATNGLATTVFI